MEERFGFFFTTVSMFWRKRSKYFVQSYFSDDRYSKTSWFRQKFVKIRIHKSSFKSVALSMISICCFTRFGLLFSPVAETATVDEEAVEAVSAVKSLY